MIGDKARRKQRYAAEGRYHPIYNPTQDLMLAPLNKLWLPAAAVRSYVLEYYTPLEVWRQFGHHTPNGRAWARALGENQWVRFDIADRLLCALGLIVTHIDVEPTYGGHPPGRRSN